MSIAIIKTARHLKRHKLTILTSIMLAFLMLAYIISISPTRSNKLSKAAYLQVKEQISQALNDAVYCKKIFNLQSNSELDFGRVALPGEMTIANRHIELSRPTLLDEDKTTKLFSIKMAVSNRRQVADLYFLKIRVTLTSDHCQAFVERPRKRNE